MSVLCVWVARLLYGAVPLVSGWIHDVAQLIFSGQPSNTLEKQAPIWNEKQYGSETGSLWLSEALKCQPGFNELELELELSWGNHKAESSVDPKYLQNVQQQQFRQEFNNSVNETRPAGKSEDCEGQCRWFTHQYFRSGRKTIDSWFLFVWGTEET